VAGSRYARPQPAKSICREFLIQYAIWATAFGVDGWRVDTYFYNDPNFLNQMNLALTKEFPALTVFGETLVALPLNAAYFCENNLNVPFKHNLQGVTDHPLHGALNQGLKEKLSWSDGFSKIYGSGAGWYKSDAQLYLSHNATWTVFIQ
jgi:hypothetical protein